MRLCPSGDIYAVHSGPISGSLQIVYRFHQCDARVSVSEFLERILVGVRSNALAMFPSEEFMHLHMLAC